MKFFTQLLCKHDYRLGRMRKAKRRGCYDEKLYKCTKCGKIKKKIVENTCGYYFNSWYKFKTKTSEKMK